MKHSVSIYLRSSVIIFGFFVLILSCRKTNRDNAGVVTYGDSTEHAEENGEVNERVAIDGTILDKTLREALKIAEQKKDMVGFKEKYVKTTPDSPIQVDVDMDYDFHFAKEYPHLIIKQTIPGSINIRIYSKLNDQFREVLFREQWSIEFVNDTICDVNGDGLRDFVVNEYGASGCCLKAFSNVYLLGSDGKSFSHNFRFINPTFSPAEKIIRGVCYGHPGETEMYKYKWNEGQVDTVEYISYQRNLKGEKTGKIIVSSSRSNSSEYKIVKYLSSPPREYAKIEGYEWFTGMGYE